GIRFHQRDKVADLALEGDVRHESMSGFRIHPRRIARVRVAVRVTIDYVKQEDEVVAPLDRAVGVLRDSQRSGLCAHRAFPMDWVQKLTAVSATSGASAACARCHRSRSSRLSQSQWRW